MHLWNTIDTVEPVGVQTWVMEQPQRPMIYLKVKVPEHLHSAAKALAALRQCDLGQVVTEALSNHSDIRRLARKPNNGRGL